ncbi:MAG: mercuric transport protein MerTP [Flavobacteriales bacterium]|nr:mercuric transport protein MerTP [Flavobacteriales bacterium]
MKSRNKNSKGAVATGVIAAIAASSCCIPPVIAAIAGVGGAAGSLSWMEPFRPYLMGLAIIAIVYAWYNYFKLKQEDDCGCDIEKSKWYQSKFFLIGMTLFAAVSITFPYYSGMFFLNNKKEVIVVETSNIQKINVKIEGMTCDACQNHINYSVNELAGIISITTSYVNGSAVVEFDNTQTDRLEIEKAVNVTGYKVINIVEE